MTSLRQRRRYGNVGETLHSVLGCVAERLMERHCVSAAPSRV